MGKKTINYGICLLRVWMCLEVIMNHWWSEGPVKNWMTPFLYVLVWAVPVFMVISFYLTGDVFLGKKQDKLLNRLCRLILPQLAWAVIYTVIYSIMGKSFDWKGLLYLTFLGHGSSNDVMWFQVNLIIITAVFALIFYFCPKRTANILVGLLGAGALFLQYSGINARLFADFSYAAKYPLGRLSDMVPLACIGLFASEAKVYDLLKKKTGTALTGIAASLAGLFFACAFLRDVPGSYGYAGIKYMLIAFCLTGLFFLLPLEHVPSIIQKGFLWLSKFTLGIYCMNNLIATLFIDRSGLLHKSFYGCLGVFVISWCISFLIWLIPLRQVRGIVS